MTGGIFILHEDGKLDEMKEQSYNSEALLQELLAKYPNLLAGDQMDSDQPRRWLLVSREMGVPGEEDGADRWSLDHLFLDQDAIPTLVEVKRSNDTRVRREVVGQMLDYAANAVAYWPVETIRARFEKTSEQQGLDPASALAVFLAAAGDAESFWQKAKTNLQAGRIRLIFVADEIPQELRRVVEFLNGQMDPAEVLAVEVKQYVGQGSLKTLVPRLIGQTARKIGSAIKPARIGEEAFLQEMLQTCGPAECDAAKRLIQWAREQRLGLSFNKRQVVASFIPTVESAGEARYPISLQTGGKIYFQMNSLRRYPPFNDDSKRKELQQRLNKVPNVKVDEEQMTGQPSVLVKTLTDEPSLRAFLATITWLVGELQSVTL